MHVTTPKLAPKEIAQTMVRCIQEATEEDIREDIRRSGIKTHISVSTRIWDYINTGLITNLEARDCIVSTKHRGLWEMVIVYERTSQCVFTFMREDRFYELQKGQSKRNHMHYLDIFGKALNSDLKEDQEQLNLFDEIESGYTDEDDLPQKIQELLSDLGGEAERVRHHVLVLFEEAHFHLTSVRAVMVTSKLEIAKDCEEDWSRYITIAESPIVEQVDDPASPSNAPALGLQLSGKALERKDKGIKIKRPGEESQMVK